jgi:hypothetical protein
MAGRIEVITAREDERKDESTCRDSKLNKVVNGFAIGAEQSRVPEVSNIYRSMNLMHTL